MSKISELLELKPEYEKIGDTEFSASYLSQKKEYFSLNNLKQRRKKLKNELNALNTLISEAKILGISDKESNNIEEKNKWQRHS